MKCGIALLLAALVASGAGLRWSPNPPDQQITNYFLYQATGTNDFVKTPVGTNTIYSLTVTSAMQFYLTAANVLGESPPTKIISVPAPATAPEGIVIIIP